MQNDSEKQSSLLYRLQINGKLSITIPVPFWILWGARTPQKLGKYIKKLIFLIKIAQFWATEISLEFFHIIRPRRIRLLRSWDLFIRKNMVSRRPNGVKMGCGPPILTPLGPLETIVFPYKSTVGPKKSNSTWSNYMEKFWRNLCSSKFAYCYKKDKFFAIFSKFFRGACTP